MRRGEGMEPKAVHMTLGVLLGGLLALGVELILLLLGAMAISNGIVKQGAALQLTAAACVIGCLVGGRLACAWWPARRLLAGLAAGGVCFLLILAVGLLWGGELSLGLQALIELAGCLCGGAIAGLLCRGKNRRKKGGSRAR
ncbi:MAG TPA: TIGR04086 family membrane protein [Candidatus Enterenecus merdae]|nr:TIGR04086 family membrane protein [Candidatus Enterenecus merdae]